MKILRSLIHNKTRNCRFLIQLMTAWQCVQIHWFLKMYFIFMLKPRIYLFIINIYKEQFHALKNCNFSNTTLLFFVNQLCDSLSMNSRTMLNKQPNYVAIVKIAQALKVLRFTYLLSTISFFFGIFFLFNFLFIFSHIIGAFSE